MVHKFLLPSLPFQPEFLRLDQPTPSELKERESLKNHYKYQLRTSNIGGVGKEKMPPARANIGSIRTSQLPPQIPDTRLAIAS